MTKKNLPLKLLKPLGELTKAINPQELIAKIEKIDANKLLNGSDEEKKLEGINLAKVLAEMIFENLEAAAEPFVSFVAVYKGVELAEAEELDIMETIKELMRDFGVASFLSS